MNWGNPSNPDTQNGKGIAFDSSGNLTVVGAFNTTIKIGPGGGILTAASAADPATGLNTNNTDVFFARLSGADGSSRCAARFGSATASYWLARF
jgi:hypothetical protein